MKKILFLLAMMNLSLVSSHGKETSDLSLPNDVKELSISTPDAWTLEIKPDGSEHLTFGAAARRDQLRKGSTPFLEVYEKLKVGLKIGKPGEFDTSIFLSILDQHNVSHTFVIAKDNREYVLHLMQTALGKIEDEETKKELSQILKERPFLPPPAK